MFASKPDLSAECSTTVHRAGLADTTRLQRLQTNLGGPAIVLLRGSPYAIDGAVNGEVRQMSFALGFVAGAAVATTVIALTVGWRIFRYMTGEAFYD